MIKIKIKLKIIIIKAKERSAIPQYRLKFILIKFQFTIIIYNYETFQESAVGANGLPKERILHLGSAQGY